MNAWGEVSATHLSGQRNRLKLWELMCRFLLVDCYDCLVSQDGLCIKICWRLDLCKEGPGFGQLEQESDSQGAFLKVIWATSHG